MVTKSVLNRGQRKHMDVLLKKRKQSVIDSITDETGEIWRQAQQNLQWIVGDPVRLPEGVKVDFSMFDFIVATTKFIPDDMTSDLKMLQRFWITIFPHVDNVISNLNHYKLKFREIYGVEDTTLRNYAIQNLELQCYRKFMEEELSKVSGFDMSEQIKFNFTEYHKKFKDDSDAEIAKMKVHEDARVQKQMDREKKRIQDEKTRALAAKLSI